MQRTLTCFSVTSGNTKANKRKTKVEDLKKSIYKLNTCEFCQNKPWKELGVKNKGEDTCSCNSPKQLVHTEHRALPHCSLEPLTEYRAMHSSYTYYISTVFNIQVKFLCCLPDVQTGAHVCIISGLEGPVQER